MSMRVVYATRFGGPEVLVAADAPEPSPGPGRVVVEVAVAQVLFLDTQLRSGWGSEYFVLEPPYVPGGAVAGTVVSVGDGVDPGWSGRRVLASTPSGTTGGYAQRAEAMVEQVVEVPDGMDLRDALAAFDGMTALSFMEKADIRPGGRVLVGAAGGSLGIWLVPLAHAAGAHVIAAARGTQKLDLARELGADAVIDYSRPGWTDEVREATGGAGVDVVFDGAGGQIGRAAFEVTAQGGRFLSYGAASGDFALIQPHEAEQQQITIVGILDDPLTLQDRKRLTHLALSEIAAGNVRPVIGQAFPLDRAADAHAAIAARTAIGRTVLLT
jgi:NADPH2:quinone reductase